MRYYSHIGTASIVPPKGYTPDDGESVQPTNMTPVYTMPETPPGASLTTITPGTPTTTAQSQTQTTPDLASGTTQVPSGSTWYSWFSLNPGWTALIIAGLVIGGYELLKNKKK